MGKNAPSASPLYLARSVPVPTQLVLYGQAAGRCQFDGCNEYLLKHHVTHRSGNYGEKAHICAFSEGGPRFDEQEPEKHRVENLMLLCARCHKQVDDDPERFSVETLRKFKKAHEDRVFDLTDTRPDRVTIPVVVRGNIAGQPAQIPLGDQQAAVAPRNINARNTFEIDLTALHDEGTNEFWALAAKTIRQQLSGFYGRDFGGDVARHVSVFALAPIPLLMVVGECLSSKVGTSLYQRHRDTEDWAWKSGEEPVVFDGSPQRRGSDASAVALLVSVSGKVQLADLPPEIDGRYNVYAIEPVGSDPSLGILRTEATLRSFRSAYQNIIRTITAQHPEAKRIALFPAVPAPCAVAMGRDLLPKRDPVLDVFDFNKNAGGFARTLEVNAHDAH